MCFFHTKSSSSPQWINLPSRLTEPLREAPLRLTQAPPEPRQNRLSLRSNPDHVWVSVSLVRTVQSLQLHTAFGIRTTSRFPHFASSGDAPRSLPERRGSIAGCGLYRVAVPVGASWTLSWLLAVLGELGAARVWGRQLSPSFRISVCLLIHRLTEDVEKIKLIRATISSSLDVDKRSHSKTNHISHILMHPGTEILISRSF